MQTATLQTDIEKLPPLFDTRTLARWSGLETRRWVDLRMTGQGPEFVRVGSRQVVYTRASVADWLAKQARKSTADQGADMAAAA